MSTYVVALTHREFQDYCSKRGVPPSAATLVRSKADLRGVEIGNDRVVFYGRCYELPEIDDLLEQILENGSRERAHAAPRRSAQVYELR